MHRRRHGAVRAAWDGTACGSRFWGDWEASDSAGNLIANDHLDLLDYLVARAKRARHYMLFSPIQLYSSTWPDAMQDTSPPGFGRRFGKGRMGTDSTAIRAQVNYLRQILTHVKPVHARRAERRAEYPVHRARERAVAPSRGHRGLDPLPSTR